MEKKKTKLTISGSSKKTISNIERARTQGKNSVIIEKKSLGFGNKSNIIKKNNKKDSFKIKSFRANKGGIFSKPSASPFLQSDFEKRKLAEQRAKKRLKGETLQKGKLGSKKRELKLTISRALSDEDMETKGRSLASLRRAKKKENRDLNKAEHNQNLKKVKRDVHIQ